MNKVLQGTTPKLVITIPEPITVAAIPYREEANAYGTTVIIG